ncbi:MAG TPA: non-homologous end-joining DNA ligase, partial [Stellaceae bacterium]|nr:non-homologous end-joining DNA ligase [Stellaceae bacterium]
HARLDRGKVKLLTRTGLDWTDKYGSTADAIAKVKARTAYLDGELCAVNPDGTTSFAELQAATDSKSTTHLVYFAFDLLFLNGDNLTELRLLDRKERLRKLLKGASQSIQYSGHHLGDGKRFLDAACGAKAEGIISKRMDCPYKPGNRGFWVKTKCINEEEFVIVGYSEPDGSRPYLGALLLAYYDDDGRLIYGGRAGTGMSQAELKRVYDKLRPLRVSEMPLDKLPPRSTRFGSPLVLSRVQWVKPKLVCQVRFLTWTADGLLRQVSYRGLREDKAAKEVRRTLPR